MPDDLKTEADFAYERYDTMREFRPENDIPDDDLLPHDTRVTQSLSESEGSERDPAAKAENSAEAPEEFEAYESLPDVPDADAIQKDSPADPAAPDPDAMHGTDLLNGYAGEDT